MIPHIISGVNGDNRFDEKAPIDYLRSLTSISKTIGLQPLLCLYKVRFRMIFSENDPVH